MNELISVIIPVYNVEAYIDECINSVVNQTYRNLEIILVNDGSTDASYENCLKWKEKDNRIVLLVQVNQGVSVARNAALDCMKGEYVTFVDSDDVIAKDTIECLKHGIEETQQKACMCNFETFDDDVPSECLPYEKAEYEIVSASDCCKHLFDENHIVYGTVCGGVYHRSLFEKIRFPSGRYYEDTYIISDFYREVDAIAYIDRKCYFYRQRKGSTTFDWSDRKVSDSLYATAHRVELFMAFEDFDLKSKTIQLHLNHAISSYYRADANECKCECRKYFTDVFKKYGKEYRISTKNYLKLSIFQLSPVLYAYIWRR